MACTAVTISASDQSGTASRIACSRRSMRSLSWRTPCSGELTVVWVPDGRHEAMRDLSRARQAAYKDLQGKRQQISSLMCGSGEAAIDFARAQEQSIVSATERINNSE